MVHLPEGFHMTSPMAGLGRLLSKDDRDHKFMLPHRPEAGAKAFQYWTPGPVLDQGATPQCVGYSGYGWLTAFPVSNRPPFTPTDLYHFAQQEDEWPGEDYEGSSVRGLFKALKARGFVSEYNWALDVGPIIDHLLVVGPVVMGTIWTEGMFTADHAGFIDDIGGKVAGGHAYLLIGANRLKRAGPHSKGAVRVLNSWGPNWEDHGRAWLSFEALAWLLSQDGEACTAMELKVKV
jgi:hypothetical protein